MNDDTDEIRRQLAGKSQVKVRAGRYVGTEHGLALVDMGDQRFPVPFLTGFVPQVNESCWVLTVDGLSFMVGPTTAKPGFGVVSTVAEPHVTVTTDFGDFTMAYAGETPTSGDYVGISWSTAPYCVVLSTSPAEQASPPAPGGGGGTVVEQTFRAVWAGTTHANGDWWQAQVWAAENNVGAWGYGAAIKDTIPASAQFVSLEIYLPWTKRFGSAPNFGLHSLASQSGTPAFGATSAWFPPSGWQTPPDAEGWFNDLKAGGARWGVGINHGGYSFLASLAQDGMSGALRIKWK